MCERSRCMGFVLSCALGVWSAPPAMADVGVTVRHSREGVLAGELLLTHPSFVEGSVGTFSPGPASWSGASASATDSMEDAPSGAVSSQRLRSFTIAGENDPGSDPESAFAFARSSSQWMAPAGAAFVQVEFLSDGQLGALRDRVDALMQANINISGQLSQGSESRATNYAFTVTATTPAAPGIEPESSIGVNFGPAGTFDPPVIAGGSGGVWNVSVTLRLMIAIDPTMPFDVVMSTESLASAFNGVGAAAANFGATTELRLTALDSEQTPIDASFTYVPTPSAAALLACAGLFGFLRRRV